MPQQRLDTMKLYNQEINSWKEKELVSPLLSALQLATAVFDENAFRRVEPLFETQKAKRVPRKANKVWKPSTVHHSIWDCTVYSFSLLDNHQQRTVQQNSEVFRDALIELMQTEPFFTDSLRIGGTRQRIRHYGAKIDQTLSLLEDKDCQRTQIPRQVRQDMIRNALEHRLPCPLCKSRLPPLKEHLDIDHIIPVSKGGTNDIENLQVVHRTCNREKPNKIQE